MYDSKKDNIEYIDDAFILSLKQFQNRRIVCVLIDKFFFCALSLSKGKKKRSWTEWYHDTEFSKISNE